MYFSVFILTCILYSKLRKWWGFASKPNILYIMRGVSGSGKDHYITQKEEEIEETSKYYSEDEYTVISSDDYFYSEKDEYNFNPKELPIAYSECMTEFLKAIDKKVPRIYISNIHSKQWEYNNYIRIASMFGYGYDIIEMECPDDDTLSYFTERSEHGISVNKNKQIFENWEKDEDADLIEHMGEYNYSCLDGDSLPYPKKTKEQLDEELDKIKRQ